MGGKEREDELIQRRGVVESGVCVCVVVMWKLRVRVVVIW